MPDIRLDLTGFDSPIGSMDPVSIDTSRLINAAQCVDMFMRLTGGKESKDKASIMYFMKCPFDEVQRSMIDSRMVPIIGPVHATQSRHTIDGIFLDKDLTRLDTEGTLRWVDAIRRFCRHLGLSSSTFADHMSGNVWIGSETDISKRLAFGKDAELYYINSVHEALSLIAWIYSIEPHRRSQ